MSTRALRVVEPITYERIPPHNAEAEQYILGAIILNNQTLVQAAEKLKSEDFFTITHQRIYTRMLVLFEEGRGIDPITLCDELRKVGELDIIGGAAYVASLYEGVPRFSDITNYVRIVKNKAILRRLITTCNLSMMRAFDDEEEPTEILSAHERELFTISEETIKKDFVRVGDVAGERLIEIENVGSREELITGVATGFADIDYMTSGLQKGDLIIVAARPSMGKTGLAVNIAQNAALRRTGTGERAVIAIFSLEMSTEQLVMRMLCSQARVDAHRLRSGYLNKDEWRRLAIAVGELSEADLYIDDTAGISLMEARAKARKLKTKLGRLDLLIFDYLTLITPHGKPRTEQEATAQISKELKGLAKELQVPLVALSQLSRAPESRSGGHRPQLSDLRSSGQIEQDADLVMFIYREEVYKPETDKQNIAEIIIGKQRNGPVGSVELVFLKQLTKFEDKFRERNVGYQERQDEGTAF